MTIWKFEIPIDDSFTIAMPVGSEVLTVQAQHDRPCIWALVEPDKPVENRRFLLFGTGHPVPAEHGKYVGTFQVHGGALVFHLFEQ